jgi:hypothetical protein
METTTPGLILADSDDSSLMAPSPPFAEEFPVWRDTFSL